MTITRDQLRIRLIQDAACDSGAAGSPALSTAAREAGILGSGLGF